MTVLSRLLTPTTAEKSVADRIAELDSQSADFIARIALTDGDEGVRAAAVAKLPLGDALLKLAGLQGTSSSATIELSARKRLAQLIDGQSGLVEQLLSSGVDWSALLAVTALCADPVHVPHVVARIENSESLVGLATSAASSKVRQAAAEALSDPGQLRRVLKQVRGSDKNVYKIVKAKLDALLAQDKAAAETQAHIESLCAALERHSHLPFDNLFAPTLEYLGKQWAAVAQLAQADARTRAEAALERCHATATKHVREVASQAAHEANVANADANRAALFDGLRTLLVSAFEGADVSALSTLASRWAEINHFKAPDPSERQRYERMREAIETVTQLILDHGPLPTLAAPFLNAQVAGSAHETAAASTPSAELHEREKVLRKILSFRTLLGTESAPSVADAEGALQAWRQARRDQEEAHAHALRQLSGLIRKASGALRDGQSRHAAGIRRALEDRLLAFGPLPEALQKQLHALDEKLKELKDWKSYAVAPKRIELIEAMEALVGSSMSPKELAEQIKRLQDEWKVISKGATDNSDQEWQRFHLAAQSAFGPCKDYFAAQAKQREGNLEKRKALLARLTAFEQQHNWEQPDWREVARAVRESRQQWRNHQPVERGPNKPLQSAFDALSAKLQTLLDGEYAKNLEVRRQLIERAQHLIGIEDTRKAIEGAKQLQLAWKNAGVAPREEDQKLWAEFRQHCDAIFAKRDQQHSEHVAGLEANKTHAVALCLELEQMLSLSGPELMEAAKKVSVLRQSFDTMGELPKAIARDLSHRFDRGLDRFDKAIARQRTLDKAQSWNALLDAGDRVRRYRLAVANQFAGEVVEGLRQSTQEFIDSVQHWPKGGLQVIRSEFAKAGAADIASNESALRTLCVRAEILTDSPSPPSDQAFRRNYQLQLLKQSIGEGLGKAQSVKEELDALVFEWIAVGATSDAVYQELTSRFHACRAKVLPKS